MKNTIICGSARTGKSTLGRMLKKENPDFNIIEGDTIYQAILKNIDKNSSECINDKGFLYSNLSRRIFKEIIKRLIKFQNEDGPFIYIGEQIFPEDLKDLINENSNTKVYYLVHGDISEEEIFNNIRKNDSDNDWTDKKTDAELKEKIKEIKEHDNYLISELQKTDFKHFKTSDNRNYVFESIIKDLNN